MVDKGAPQSNFDAASAADRSSPTIDVYRAQHLAIAKRSLVIETGRSSVFVNEAESPLAWLARRRGRNGRALIETHQLQAGERLRSDFTRAQLMPRTTSNWESPVSPGRSGASAGREGVFTDGTIAARQRVQHAVKATGPEFSGLLLDVCCFLKGLEDVERERGWPARSAKIVQQLALESLARHYGFAAQTRGRPHAAVRTWLAQDPAFIVDV